MTAFPSNIGFDASFNFRCLQTMTKMISDRHGRPQGGQNGHLPPLEIGTKKQNYIENVK